MGRFVNVGKVDVARGTGKLVFIEGLSIALLNSDGAFYGLRSYRVRLDKQDIYVDLGHHAAPEKSEDEIAAVSSWAP